MRTQTHTHTHYHYKICWQKLVTKCLDELASMEESTMEVNGTQNGLLRHSRKSWWEGSFLGGLSLYLRSFVLCLYKRNCMHEHEFTILTEGPPVYIRPQVSSSSSSSCILHVKAIQYSREPFTFCSLTGCLCNFFSVSFKCHHFG